MKRSPQISIITINYGGSPQVKKLWTSLKTHAAELDYEFIVVDNASPNHDAAVLETLFKNTPVHLIKLKKNLGFGGGYSEGIKFARGKYLAIINPDIQITPHCLEILIQQLSEKEVGLVAPKLLNPDQSPQQNARHFPTPWVMFGRRLSSHFHWAYDSEDTWYKSKTPQAVDWVQGSFMCLKKEVFTDQLKGFDSRFFLFLEDTDLCRRLWQQKLRVLLIPPATAIHSEHRLSGGSFWQACRKKTFWIHLHSALKYFWKYKGKKLPEVK